MPRQHQQQPADLPRGPRKVTPQFATPAIIVKKTAAKKKRHDSSDDNDNSSEYGDAEDTLQDLDIRNKVVDAPTNVSAINESDEVADDSSVADYDSSEVGDDGNEDDSDEEDEEEDVDEDSSDDGTTEITVDFDVNEMNEADLVHIYHLMDQLIPDHAEEVDRDDLAGALLASPFTSIVKLGTEASTDETDIFGLFSFLDVAHGVRGPRRKSFSALVKLLRENVYLNVAPGLPCADVLTALVEDSKSAVAAEDRPSKAVLVVSEYIRNVPLELTSRILSHSITEFQRDAQKWSKKRDKSVPLFTAFPCVFIVLAKIQRSAELVKKLEGKGGADTPRKKKARKESASSIAEAATGKLLDLAEFIFWRDEDEVLYQFHDKRVAVDVYRCRAQYDGQPHSEIPLTLSFALTNEGLVQASTAIRAKESLTAV